MKLIMESWNNFVNEGDTWSDDFGKKYNREDALFHPNETAVTVGSLPMYYAQVIQHELTKMAEHQKHTKSVGEYLVKLAPEFAHAMTGQRLKEKEYTWLGKEKKYKLQGGVKHDDYKNFAPSLEKLGNKLMNVESSPNTMTDYTWYKDLDDATKKEIKEVLKTTKEIIERMS
jgi:hypothetical protein